MGFWLSRLPEPRPSIRPAAVRAGVRESSANKPKAEAGGKASLPRAGLRREKEGGELSALGEVEQRAGRIWARGAEPTLQRLSDRTGFEKVRQWRPR